VKKATEAGYLDPNITTTYEEMKKFVAEGNYTKPYLTNATSSSRSAHLQRPLIFQRGWILLKAPVDSGGFITSDHPVCLTTVGP